MKISEVILKSLNCTPGWQDPEIYPEPIRNGSILLRERLNDDCETDEYAFVYYNRNMSDYEDGWIVSYAMRNQKIIWYDVFNHKNGQIVGTPHSLTKEDVKTMFLNSVAEYL